MEDEARASFGEEKKAAVAALVEEYKSRLLQIVAYDAEVSRWTASYAVGLTVGVAWVLGNDKVGNFAQFFLLPDQRPNYIGIYLLFLLTFINSLYMLWLAVKGFRTQQIQYYLHTVVAPQIESRVGVSFNKFEVWRRVEFTSKYRVGETDWRRLVYYGGVSILPLVVSVPILFMYARNVLPVQTWETYRSARLDTIASNTCFALLVLIHLGTVIVALSTTSFNETWRRAAENDLAVDGPTGLGSFLTLARSAGASRKRVEVTADEEQAGVKPQPPGAA